MVRSLRQEEKVGLAVAAALHLALVLAFLMQPETRADMEPAQRMTVNLAEEVGLEAAAPVPVPESRAAIAPTLSDEPAPVPTAEPLVRPVVQPRQITPAPSRPAPAKPAPVKPAPSRPAPAKPAPVKPAPSRPAPAKPAPAKPAPAKAIPAKPAPKKGGGQLVGDNFLAGLGGSTTTNETRAPASAIGASERASLLQAIVREVKPRWQPPSGPDVDRLVSKVRFRLNRDGSLDGRPQLVSQRGENDTNRTQAARHGEQAIRAVQLAAPFDLPENLYAGWKTVTLDFDWKLSQ